MPPFGDPGDSDTDSSKVVAFVRHLQQLSSSEEVEMERLQPEVPCPGNAENDATFKVQPIEYGSIA